MKRTIFILASAALLTASCRGTWLMYDTSQKDRLYFQESKQTHVTSFALIADDDVTVQATLYLMGVPAGHDRTYSIEYIPAAAGDTLSTGGITYPVVTARPDIDFSVGERILPAGAIEAKLDIILHRTPEMLDSNLIRVGIRLRDDENFLAAAPDSHRVSAIMGPDYYLYVSDGEPACPSWWKDGNSPIGWDWDLGNFYPSKYRRLLELFHATEETDPTFFAFCSAAYGYNLDEPNLAYYAVTSTSPDSEDDRKADMMRKFWRKRYMAAWARYVFIPLYDYYAAYYAEHPDDPNNEPMGTLTVNRNTCTGWSSPTDPGWGFFN